MLPEVRYTPESSLLHPRFLLVGMFRDVARSRGLAWRLLLRDLRAQYRQSLLGVFWAFVPPIVTAAALTLVRNAKILNVGATELPYAAYVVLSMALWQTFADTLWAPVQAVADARQLLGRIRFPPEALVLAKLGEVSFNVGVRVLLIVLLFFWYRIPVGWTTALAPLALSGILIFGACLGLVLSPISALYTDISRSLSIAISLWFFLTPVIYPVPTDGLLSIIVGLNPMTHLLVTVRELATGQPVSAPGAFWYVTSTSCVGLFFSWLVFRVSMPFAIERMGS